MKKQLILILSVLLCVFAPSYLFSQDEDKNIETLKIQCQELAKVNEVDELFIEEYVEICMQSPEILEEEKSENENGDEIETNQDDEISEETEIGETLG